MSAPDEATMLAIRRQTVGDDEAYARWNDVWKALHAYAHASGAPLGRDVLEWFRGKTQFYVDVREGAIQNARRKPTEGA